MNAPSAIAVPATLARALRDAAVDGRSALGFHVADANAWLVRDDGQGGWQTEAVALSPQRIAERHFRADLPRPVELEHAIDHVEDELTRLATWASGRHTLVSDDPGVAELMATLPMGQSLDRETVETLFQRLASGALGQPQALVGLPTGRRAAALLLVLRELMHHFDLHQAIHAG
ncbi:MAG: hypothetical protein KF871_14430 [Hydrogenophaga sp.]|uniref:hypothetical protein n=1 Tax=Hydrogenophaga sp. TaxID=1904254 RepID=UPI001DACD842|nr:hypothetical protein [Hydrogenophaga sp.]MBX3611084.1 hypothetical protein [Hydrogenophaga sp.]